MFNTGWHSDWCWRCSCDTELRTTADKTPVLHRANSKVFPQGQHKLIQLWSKETWGISQAGSKIWQYNKHPPCDKRLILSWRETERQHMSESEFPQRSPENTLYVAVKLKTQTPGNWKCQDLRATAKASYRNGTQTITLEAPPKCWTQL